MLNLEEDEMRHLADVLERVISTPLQKHQRAQFACIRALQCAFEIEIA